MKVETVVKCSNAVDPKCTNVPKAMPTTELTAVMVVNVYRVMTVNFDVKILQVKNA